MLGEALLVALVHVVARAAAQEAAFQWGIKDSTTQSSFQECEQVPLIVLNNTGSFGVPPYYLVAFELGGVPTTTNIGSDPNNLLWKADHKRGANLMLTVVDSQNNDGGVDTHIYTVTAGSDTSCIASPAQDRPTVTSNVTETLNTCDPWNLLIGGGKKPYSLYLAALNAPTITIVKMGANDNLYTYINRAEPDTLLIASILDSNNQWGVSPQPVRTMGSTNVDCGGRQSISGISPISPLSNNTSGTPSSTSSGAGSTDGTSPNRTNHTGNASTNSTNVPLIAGLVAGLCVLLILIIGALIWWRRRRAQNASMRGTWDTHYDATTPWAPPPPPTQDMREIDAANRAGQWSAGGGQHSPTHAPLVDSTPIPSVYLDAAAPMTQSGYLDRTAGSSTLGSSTTGSGSTQDRKDTGLQPPMRTYTVLHPDEQGIIIQHRDASVVQELPPPYADAPQQTPRPEKSPRPVDVPGSGSNGSRRY